MLIRTGSEMCVALALVVSAFCATALSQEAPTPGQSRRLGVKREKLAEEFDKLKAAGVCPTCSAAGVTTAAMPEARVKHGEDPTRDVLCPTCLGTGLSGIEKLRGIMKRVIVRVRSSHGAAIDDEAAREAMRKIFHAQALLLQDEVFEKARQALARERLWTLDAREHAVRAGADPITLDVAVTMKRLARDLDLYRRKHPMPIVFERPKDDKERPKEGHVLPTEVRIEVFSLGGITRVARRFREAVVNALMLRYSVGAEEAPEGEAPGGPPAEGEGAGGASSK